MTVDVDGRAGQAAAVDQAGVVGGVAEHGVARAGERADDGEVRLIAAGKDQGRLGSLPGGQIALQRRERREQPADQRRSARTDAPSACRSDRRSRQPGIAGQGEVVVRREVDAVRASVPHFARPAPIASRRR